METFNSFMIIFLLNAPGQFRVPRICPSSFSWSILCCSPRNTYRTKIYKVLLVKRSVQPAWAHPSRAQFGVKKTSFLGCLIFSELSSCTAASLLSATAKLGLLHMCCRFSSLWTQSWKYQLVFADLTSSCQVR